MDAPTAREGSVKRVVITVALLTAGALVTAAMVRSSRTTGRAARAMARMQARLDSHEHLRDAPHGETIEGAAFLHYSWAVNEVEELFASSSLQKELWQGTLGPEEGLALVQDSDAVFARMRRGASSRDATRHSDWRDSASHREFRLHSIRSIACIAALRARSLLENGQPEAAVRELLDVQQFGADLLSSPRAIEAALGGVILAHEHLAHILESESYELLTEEAVQEWVRGMRSISASVLPTTRTVLGEPLWFYTETKEAFENGTFSPSDHARGRWTRWLPRTVWRSALEDLMVRSEPLAAEINRAYQLPRAEIAPKIESLLRRFDQRTPLFRPMRFDSLANARVECLARFEFLRHALATGAAIPDPLPESPSPDPVQVERVGGSVTVSTTITNGQTLAVTVGSPN